MTKQELISEHNQKVLELKNAGKDKIINIITIVFLLLAVSYFGIHYAIYLIRFHIV